MILFLIINNSISPDTEGQKQELSNKMNNEVKEPTVKNTLPTAAIGKEVSNGNPLVSHKFGADPYALVFENRVYLYMTADELEHDEEGNVLDNTYGSINKLSVISSADLMNWTDHGFINVAGPEGVAKWATQSWAPAVTHKKINGKDKFFLYFANNASGIGVLTSDSPLGPWVDPIGRALIDRTDKEAEGVTWLFDPAVLVDADGKGYLYYGGGVPDGRDEMPNTSRVIELGEDMISLVGEPAIIPAPFMFENAGINRLNGKYYYTYCSNFFNGERPEGSPPAGEIAYMVSDTPIGPWKYMGTILKNPGHFFGIGGNNHHVIFEFYNQLYIAYHAQTLAKSMNIANGYRSTHLNNVFLNEDGTIKEIVADYKGVSQIHALSPYKRVEAETIGWQAGVTTEPLAPNEMAINSLANRVLSELHDGDWVAISQVDFGSDGARNFKISVLPGNVEGYIELRLNSPEGVLIGQLVIPARGHSKLNEYIEFEQTVTDATDIQDLYFVFRGATDKELFKIDYWRFEK